MKRILIAALLCIGCNAAAQIFPARLSNESEYSGYLINTPGLTYNSTATIDLSQYAGSRVSAQIIFSTVTFSAATFSDGSESTDNITVVSYAGLKAAQATNQITVTSTSSLFGAYITMNGTKYKCGSDWNQKATTALTAASIAAAINGVQGISASATGSVVYATSTLAGSAYNAYTLSSSNVNITVASAHFTGGADNAVLTIGSKALTQGTDWSAASSNAQTATNIASAIAAAGLGLTASASGAVIYATSTINGLAYNYLMTSSTPTALTVSTSPMTGGTNPAFSVKGSLIALPANGFTLGLPVLYAANSASIGGLTDQTTYYVTSVGTNQIALSTTLARAVAGIPLTFTSTTSQTSAHAPTLTALPIAGSPSITWQASNDGSNFATTLSTGPIAMSTTSSASDLLIDFGSFNFRYLRSSIVAPTAGAMLLQIPVNIKQDGIGRF
jgi:hypothetical protein